ncbi:MAG TPA: lipoprotein [Castellaniella sp.]|nr:lipoprotein [Castellaniella sp.]
MLISILRHSRRLGTPLFLALALSACGMKGPLTMPPPPPPDARLTVPPTVAPADATTAPANAGTAGNTGASSTASPSKPAGKP